MQNETTLPIPDTQNKATGFWGTISPHADAATAWQAAFLVIVAACDRIDAETIRAFLDSYYGWQLAEEVIDQMRNYKFPVAEAVEVVVRQWSLTRTRPRGRTTDLIRSDARLHMALKGCHMPATYAFPIPDSQNTAEGFWGTIRPHADAGIAWRRAFTAIVEVRDGTGTAHETIRVFLDSHYGRDLAEEVIDLWQDRNLPLSEAIETAVEKWLDWTLPRTMASETGMRRGHSYLDGVLKRCEALASGA